MARKNAAAVALGRRGGIASGKVRMLRLTSDQRRDAARHAARARWTAYRAAQKAARK